MENTIIMSVDLSLFNWWAIAVCLVFAQVFLSIWFIVLFGTPWAKEYGVPNKKQHAKEIPGYTYGIQAACAFVLILGIASLQSMLGVKTLVGGLSLGIFVVFPFAFATALPGYIFLKRMNAFWMAIGSQIILILAVSVILALWQ